MWKGATPKMPFVVDHQLLGLVFVCTLSKQWHGGWMTYGDGLFVAAGGPHLVANSWRSLGALSSLARPPDLHTSSSQSQCASCHQLPLVKKKYQSRC